MDYVIVYVLAMALPLLVADSDYRITYANDAACLATGTCHQMALGSRVQEILGSCVKPVLVQFEPKKQKKVKKTWSFMRDLINTKSLTLHQSKRSLNPPKINSVPKGGSIFDNYSWFYNNYENEDVLICDSDIDYANRVAKDLSKITLKRSILVDSGSNSSSEPDESDSGRSISSKSISPEELPIVLGRGETYGLILLDAGSYQQNVELAQTVKEYMKCRSCLVLITTDNDLLGDKDLVNLSKINGVINKSDKNGFYRNIAKILSGVSHR